MVKKYVCTSSRFVLLRSATPFRTLFPNFVKLSTPSRFFFDEMVHGMHCDWFRWLLFLLLRWLSISCLSIIIYHCVEG